MSDIEAIKILKEHLSHWERLLREHICDEQEGIDIISALKLAIASLETDEVYQLEYEQPKFCEDCISRAEAIKGVETWSRGWIEYIKSLPSVYPKSKTFTENCIACVYDEIETETGAHCKKCLEGDSQYKSIFDFVKENLTIKALERESPAKNDLGVDAVSRETINRYIDYILSHGMGKKKSFDFIKKFVANLPSAAPIRPKGHWIKYEIKYMTEKRLTPVTHFIRECSVCHIKFADFYGIMNFCPHCGANMREVVEE